MTSWDQRNCRKIIELHFLCLKCGSTNVSRASLSVADRQCICDDYRRKHTLVTYTSHADPLQDPRAGESLLPHAPLGAGERECDS